MNVFAVKIQNLKSAARWFFILFLTLGALAAPLNADAQPPTRIFQIGYLTTGSSSENLHLLDAFRQGLRDLAYVEGKHFRIESRATEGRNERLPDLAAELVRLKVDVIVAGGGTGMVLPVKKATSSIPIVFTNVSDPVGAELAPNRQKVGG